MGRNRCVLCLLALVVGAGVLGQRSGLRRNDGPHGAVENPPKTKGLARPAREAWKAIACLPLSFEPAAVSGSRRRANGSGAATQAQYVARAQGMTVALTGNGITIRREATGSARTGGDDEVQLRFGFAGQGTRKPSAGALNWTGQQRERGVANYLLGRDQNKWRLGVPRYAKAEARLAGPGRLASSRKVELLAYGDSQDFEYDLRIPAGVDARNLRIAARGARGLRIDANGNLWLKAGETEIRMKKPEIYEEASEAESEVANVASDRRRRLNGATPKTPRRPRGPRTRKKSSRSASSSARRERRYRARRRIRGGNTRPPTMRRPRSGAPRRQRRPNRQSGPAPTSSPRRGTSVLDYAWSEGTELRGFRERERKIVDGQYILEADGAVGFRVGPHDASATLVIDPSISIAYATFVGGPGSEEANSVAMDSLGNVYVAGTTTLASSFPEQGNGALGPGGATDFFVAKIDPTKYGADSLVYLTFLGGSGDETGGLVDVDGQGNVAVAGTTTSTDFPVTDGSTLTSGGNDATVTEIDGTGSKLIYSTMFGGNGEEATQGAGGIALDGAGNIFIASDTSSTNLAVTAGAFHAEYGGGSSDGFLAEFAPNATPHLKYCTYLGIDAQVGVGGVAVDGSGEAYVAGFTTNPGASFPAKNATQAEYGGDPDDAFVMKFDPSGKGSEDLEYATLLGGGGMDEAYAVAVDGATPAKAYVTGMTASSNFPVSGAVGAFQSSLHAGATANAFLAVVAQDPGTGATWLQYSTYLGGSETDSGEAVAVTAANAVYVAGETTSFDFPWANNLEPYNGTGDAFVVKMDPTSAGTASVVYSTPLGGISPPGGAASAMAEGIAADGGGHVYVAGQTTAAGFPSGGSPGNGFQLICESCQENPAEADAFLAEILEGSAQEPSVYFSAARLNFAAQVVGSNNVPPQFAAVYNGGETPLQIASMTITGTNSGDFSLLNPGPCLSAAINPGAICSFGVGFVPSVVGPEAATVTLTDNAPGSPQALEIAGVGDGPLASVSPTSLDFGTQTKGTTSAAQFITVTNAGNQTLTFSDVAPGGANATQFPLSGVPTCVSNASLAPGASCTMGVTFAPNGTGPFSAEIDFFDNSGGSAGSEQVVVLTGAGTAAVPQAVLTPTSVQFGSESVGSSTAAQTVTLTNSGGAGLNFTGVSVTGTNAADFAIETAGGNPCPMPQGTIASGANCTVGVAFTPQTAGSKTATLSFADDAPGSPQGVALSGTANAPTVQISPSNLSFGSQSAGTTSAAETILISNTGSSTVSINGISFSGTNTGDFSETDNCTPEKSLGAGASCQISVTFQPSGAGPMSASLNVADNAAGSPQAVSLSGTGTQAALAISPASIGFGSQLSGVASAPVTITLTNNGTGALVVSTAVMTGPNSGDFSISANKCSGANVSVAPNGMCTLQVIFTPVCLNGAAARSATLTFTDNAPGSPQSLALSGTAAGNFCVTGATTESVGTGGTANFSLNATAVNGYAGSDAFTVNGCPPSAACSVSPPSVSVAGNLGTPFSVQVATTAGSAAAIHSAGRKDGQEEISLAESYRIRGRLAAMLCFIMLLFWGIQVVVRRSEEKELKRWLAMAVLAAGLTMAFTGCGAGPGGGGSGGGISSTPAGTYPVTLTGTANGTAQTIALTLTVN